MSVDRWGLLAGDLRGLHCGTAGVTGTRWGMSSLQRGNMLDFLSVVQPSRVRHGDCKGVDEETHFLCRGLRVPVTVHPPSDDKWRAFCLPLGLLDEVRVPKPYLDRDLDIVTESEYLVACPRQNRRPGFNAGSGTWTTVGYAEAAGRLVVVFWPDGRVQVLGGGL